MSRPRFSNIAGAGGLQTACVLVALCLPAPNAAADTTCGSEYACIADESVAVTASAERSGSLAVLERCPEAPVDVTAATADERRLACSAARHAIQLLGRCAISLQRPLRVQIMSEVRHPLGGTIFGFFDTKQEKVLVTQEANIPSLVRDTPYDGLSQRDFYKSLIVHEVIHGVMHQNLKRPAVTHAAYEYPAYALQIESLPDDVRETFLQSFDESAKAANAMFHDAILFFNPYYFAARAYHHFKASDNACALLVTLLDGDAPFIAPPQM